MTRMDEYAGDEAIRSRFRRGLGALAAACATAGLAGAVAQAAGGPAGLDPFAVTLGGVALLLAGSSLRLRPSPD